ncbi:MAG: lytic transglycosylase domain-containing protein [Paracoccaceae bacterium]
MRPVLLAILLLAVMAPAAIAQSLSSKSPTRLRLLPQHERLISTRLQSQYGRPSAFGKSRVNISPYFGGGNSVYEGTARQAARRHGVPEDLFLRLVKTESNWNPKARSSKGAIGLAQLMPGTARKMGVNPHHPSENLDGGARYLRLMYDRFRSWRLALAAYNAGPLAVEKYGGIPPYRETRNYVKRVMGS